MERLAAQGAAEQRSSLSLKLQLLTMPEALFSELTASLPELFRESFRTLVVQPENDQSWKQMELLFQDFSTAALTHIPQIADDTKAIRKILENQLTRALDECRIAREEERAARAQIEALTSK